MERVGWGLCRLWDDQDEAVQCYREIVEILVDFDTKKCNLLIPQQRPRSKVGMGNALDDVKASSLLDELNHSSNDNSMSSSHTMGCLGIF